MSLICAADKYLLNMFADKLALSIFIFYLYF